MSTSQHGVRGTLKTLSLPTSFSHMHQASFYSRKTPGKPGQFDLPNPNGIAALSPGLRGTS